ncbi:MAG: HAD hydrolase-like protein [Methanomassiliicoccales archaeon]|nr:HAD hydrolase-like protein [Methanomassiliicoccales archaeon]
MSTGNGYEAALLDFDMTLVNMSDLVDWNDAARRVREKLHANGFQISNLRHLPVSLLREAAMHDALGPETRKERWMAASNDLCEFECSGVENTTLKEGGLELLSYLHSSSVSVAITSSNCGRAIEYCIGKLSLKHLITLTVSRDDVLWEMKPNGRAISLALDRLGVSADKTFGLGDSIVDIQAFRSAGVAAYGITGGMSSREQLFEAGALEVFENLNELIEQLSHSTR